MIGGFALFGSMHFAGRRSPLALTIISGVGFLYSPSGLTVREKLQLTVLNGVLENGTTIAWWVSRSLPTGVGRIGQQLIPVIQELAK